MTKKKYVKQENFFLAIDFIFFILELVDYNDIFMIALFKICNKITDKKVIEKVERKVQEIVTKQGIEFCYKEN